MIEGQKGSVQTSPQHKRPTGTVPQTAQQHGDQHIQILSNRAVAVAAEWDINVIPEKIGKGDVPGTPETDQRSALIGTVKVNGNIDPEQFTHPRKDPAWAPLFGLP